jgi:hypothetical protein
VPDPSGLPGLWRLARDPNPNPNHEEFDPERLDREPGLGADAGDSEGPIISPAVLGALTRDRPPTIAETARDRPPVDSAPLHRRELVIDAQPIVNTPPPAEGSYRLTFDPQTGQLCKIGLPGNQGELRKVGESWKLFDSQGQEIRHDGQGQPPRVNNFDPGVIRWNLDGTIKGEFTRLADGTIRYDNKEGLMEYHRQDGSREIRNFNTYSREQWDSDGTRKRTEYWDGFGWRQAASVSTDASTDAEGRITNITRVTFDRMAGRPESIERNDRNNTLTTHYAGGSSHLCNWNDRQIIYDNGRGQRSTLYQDGEGHWRRGVAREDASSGQLVIDFVANATREERRKMANGELSAQVRVRRRAGGSGQGAPEPGQETGSVISAYATGPEITRNRDGDIVRVRQANGGVVSVQANRITLPDGRLLIRQPQTDSSRPQTTAPGQATGDTGERAGVGRPADSAGSGTGQARGRGAGDAAVASGAASGPAVTPPEQPPRGQARTNPPMEQWLLVDQSTGQQTRLEANIALGENGTVKISHKNGTEETLESSGRSVVRRNGAPVSITEANGNKWNVEPAAIAGQFRFTLEGQTRFAPVTSMLEGMKLNPDGSISFKLTERGVQLEGRYEGGSYVLRDVQHNRLWRTTDAGGQVKEYTWDRQNPNRLVKVERVTADAAGRAVRVVTDEVDGQGQLRAVRNSQVQDAASRYGGRSSYDNDGRGTYSVQGRYATDLGQGTVDGTLHRRLDGVEIITRRATNAQGRPIEEFVQAKVTHGENSYSIIDRNQIERIRVNADRSQIRRDERGRLCRESSTRGSTISDADAIALNAAFRQAGVTGNAQLLESTGQALQQGLTGPNQPGVERILAREDLAQSRMNLSNSDSPLESRILAATAIVLNRHATDEERADAIRTLQSIARAQLEAVARQERPSVDAQLSTAIKNLEAFNLAIELSRAGPLMRGQQVSLELIGLSNIPAVGGLGLTGLGQVGAQLAASRTRPEQTMAEAFARLNQLALESPPSVVAKELIDSIRRGDPNNVLRGLSSSDQQQQALAAARLAVLTRQAFESVSNPQRVQLIIQNIGFPPSVSELARIELALRRELGQGNNAATEWSSWSQAARSLANLSAITGADANALARARQQVEMLAQSAIGNPYARAALSAIVLSAASPDVLPVATAEFNRLQTIQNGNNRERVVGVPSLQGLASQDASNIRNLAAQYLGQVVAQDGGRINPAETHALVTALRAAEQTGDRATANQAIETLLLGLSGPNKDSVAEAMRAAQLQFPRPSENLSQRSSPEGLLRAEFAFRLQAINGDQAAFESANWASAARGLSKLQLIQPGDNNAAQSVQRVMARIFAEDRAGSAYARAAINSILAAGDSRATAALNNLQNEGSGDRRIEVPSLSNLNPQLLGQMQLAALLLIRERQTTGANQYSQSDQIAMAASLSNQSVRDLISSGLRSNSPCERQFSLAVLSAGSSHLTAEQIVEMRWHRSPDAARILNQLPDETKQQLRQDLAGRLQATGEGALTGRQRENAIESLIVLGGWSLLTSQANAMGLQVSGRTIEDLRECTKYHLTGDGDTRAVRHLERADQTQVWYRWHETGEFAGREQKDRNGLLTSFDAQGRVVRVDYGNGHWRNFERDELGNLRRIADSFGNLLTSTDGRIFRTHPANEIFTGAVEIDDDGKFRIGTGEGESVQFNAGATRSLINQRGSLAVGPAGSQVLRDLQGNIHATVDGRGIERRFSRDTSGQLNTIEVRYPDGRREQITSGFTVDDEGNVTVTAQDCSSRTFKLDGSLVERDTNNNVTRVLDKHNRVTLIERDQQTGAVAKIIYPDGSTWTWDKQRDVWVINNGTSSVVLRGSITVASDGTIRRSSAEGSTTKLTDGWEELRDGSGSITGCQAVNQFGATIKKDERGRITEINYANNTKYEFRYDSQTGLLASVLHPFGVTWIPSERNGQTVWVRQGSSPPVTWTGNIQPSADGSVMWSSTDPTLRHQYTYLHQGDGSYQRAKDGQVVERRTRSGETVEYRFDAQRNQTESVRRLGSNYSTQDSQGLVRDLVIDGVRRQFEWRRNGDGSATINQMTVTRQVGGREVKENWRLLEGSSNRWQRYDLDNNKVGPIWIGQITISEGNYREIEPVASQAVRTEPSFKVTDFRLDGHTAIRENGSTRILDGRGRVVETRFIHNGGAEAVRRYEYKESGYFATHPWRITGLDGRVWTAESPTNWTSNTGHTWSGVVWVSSEGVAHEISSSGLARTIGRNGEGLNDWRTGRLVQSFQTISNPVDPNSYRRLWGWLSTDPHTWNSPSFENLKTVLADLNEAETQIIKGLFERQFGEPLTAAIRRVYTNPLQQEELLMLVGRRDRVGGGRGTDEAGVLHLNLQRLSRLGVTGQVTWSVREPLPNTSAANDSREIRDTLTQIRLQVSGLSPVLLAELRTQWKERYGTELLNDLLACRHVAESAYDAGFLRIHLSGSDEAGPNQDGMVKLMVDAAKEGNTLLFAEACRMATQAARLEAQNKFLTNDVLPRHFSGDDLRAAQELLRDGRLSVQTQVLNSSRWFRTNDEQSINRALSELTHIDHLLFRRGEEISRNINAPGRSSAGGESSTPVKEPVSGGENDMRALQYYNSWMEIINSVSASGWLPGSSREANIDKLRGGTLAGEMYRQGSWAAQHLGVSASVNSPQQITATIQGMGRNLFDQFVEGGRAGWTTVNEAISSRLPADRRDLAVGQLNLILQGAGRVIDDLESQLRQSNAIPNQDGSILTVGSLDLSERTLNSMRASPSFRVMSDQQLRDILSGYREYRRLLAVQNQFDRYSQEQALNSDRRRQLEVFRQYLYDVVRAEARPSIFELIRPQAGDAGNPNNVRYVLEALRSMRQTEQAQFRDNAMIAVAGVVYNKDGTSQPARRGFADELGDRLRERLSGNSSALAAAERFLEQIRRGGVQNPSERRESLIAELGSALGTTSSHFIAVRNVINEISVDTALNSEQFMAEAGRRMGERNEHFRAAEDALRIERKRVELIDRIYLAASETGVDSSVSQSNERFRGRTVPQQSGVESTMQQQQLAARQQAILSVILPALADPELRAKLQSSQQFKEAVDRTLDPLAWGQLVQPILSGTLSADSIFGMLSRQRHENLAASGDSFIHTVLALNADNLKLLNNSSKDRKRILGVFSAGGTADAVLNWTASGVSERAEVQKVLEKILTQNRATDADRVRLFTLGIGVSKEDVKRILTELSPDQRRVVQDQYASSYGRNLAEDLRAKWGSDIATLVPLLRTDRPSARQVLLEAAQQTTGSLSPDSPTIGVAAYHYVLQDLYALHGQIRQANSEGRSLSPQQLTQLERQWIESIGSYREAKKEFGELLANTTITVASLAAAPFTGGLSLKGLAMVFAVGGMARVGIRSGIEGGDFDSSARNVLGTYLGGGVSAVTNFINPARIPGLNLFMQSAAREAAEQTARLGAQGAIRALNREGLLLTGAQAEQVLQQRINGLLTRMMQAGQTELPEGAMAAFVRQLSVDGIVSANVSANALARVANLVGTEIQSAVGQVSLSMASRIQQASVDLLSNATIGGFASAAGAVTEDITRGEFSSQRYVNAFFQGAGGGMLEFGFSRMGSGLFNSTIGGRIASARAQALARSQVSMLAGRTGSHIESAFDLVNNLQEEILPELLTGLVSGEGVDGLGSMSSQITSGMVLGSLGRRFATRSRIHGDSPQSSSPAQRGVGSDRSGGSSEALTATSSESVVGSDSAAPVGVITPVLSGSTVPASAVPSLIESGDVGAVVPGDSSRPVITDAGDTVVFPSAVSPVVLQSGQHPGAVVAEPDVLTGDASDYVTSLPAPETSTTTPPVPTTNTISGAHQPTAHTSTAQGHTTDSAPAGHQPAEAHIVHPATTTQNVSPVSNTVPSPPQHAVAPPPQREFLSSLAPDAVSTSHNAPNPVHPVGPLTSPVQTDNVGPVESYAQAGPALRPGEVLPPAPQPSVAAPSGQFGWGLQELEKECVNLIQQRRELQANAGSENSRELEYLNNEIRQNLEQRRAIVLGQINQVYDPMRGDITRHEEVRDAASMQMPFLQRDLLRDDNSSAENQQLKAELEQHQWQKEQAERELTAVAQTMRASGAERELLGLQGELRVLDIALAAEDGRIAATVEAGYLGADPVTGHLSINAPGAAGPYRFQDSRWGLVDGLAFRVAGPVQSADMLEVVYAIGRPPDDSHISLLLDGSPDAQPGGRNMVTGEVSIATVRPPGELLYHEAALRHTTNHEVFGHAGQFDYFDRLPESIRQVVCEAYQTWLDDPVTRWNIGIGSVDHHATAYLERLSSRDYVDPRKSLLAYFACFPEVFAELGAVYRYSTTPEGRGLSYAELIERTTANSPLGSDRASVLRNARPIYDALREQVFVPYDRGDWSARQPGPRIVMLVDSSRQFSPDKRGIDLHPKIHEKIEITVQGTPPGVMFYRDGKGNVYQQAQAGAALVLDHRLKLRVYHEGKFVVPSTVRAAGDALSRRFDASAQVAGVQHAQAVPVSQLSTPSSAGRVGLIRMSLDGLTPAQKRLKVERAINSSISDPVTRLRYLELLHAGRLSPEDILHLLDPAFSPEERERKFRTLFGERFDAEVGGVDFAQDLSQAQVLSQPQSQQLSQNTLQQMQQGLVDPNPPANSDSTSRSINTDTQSDLGSERKLHGNLSIDFSEQLGGGQADVYRATVDGRDVVVVLPNGGEAALKIRARNERIARVIDGMADSNPASRHPASVMREVHWHDGTIVRALFVEHVGEPVKAVPEVAARDLSLRLALVKRLIAGAGDVDGNIAFDLNGVARNFDYGEKELFAQWAGPRWDGLLARHYQNLPPGDQALEYASRIVEVFGSSAGQQQLIELGLTAEEARSLVSRAAWFLNSESKLFPPASSGIQYYIDGRPDGIPNFENLVTVLDPNSLSGPDLLAQKVIAAQQKLRNLEDDIAVLTIGEGRSRNSPDVVELVEKYAELYQDKNSALELLADSIAKGSVRADYQYYLEAFINNNTATMLSYSPEELGIELSNLDKIDQRSQPREQTAEPQASRVHGESPSIAVWELFENLFETEPPSNELLKALGTVELARALQQYQKQMRQIRNGEQALANLESELAELTECQDELEASVVREEIERVSKAVAGVSQALNTQVGNESVARVLEQIDRLWSPVRQLDERFEDLSARRDEIDAGYVDRRDTIDDLIEKFENKGHLSESEMVLYAATLDEKARIDREMAAELSQLDQELNQLSVQRLPFYEALSGSAELRNLKVAFADATDSFSPGVYTVKLQSEPVQVIVEPGPAVSWATVNSVLRAAETMGLKPQTIRITNDHNPKHLGLYISEQNSRLRETTIEITEVDGNASSYTYLHESGHLYDLDALKLSSNPAIVAKYVEILHEQVDTLALAAGLTESAMRSLIKKLTSSDSMSSSQNFAGYVISRRELIADFFVYSYERVRALSTGEHLTFLQLVDKIAFKKHAQLHRPFQQLFEYLDREHFRPLIQAEKAIDAVARQYTRSIRNPAFEYLQEEFKSALHGANLSTDEGRFDATSRMFVALERASAISTSEISSVALNAVLIQRFNLGWENLHCDRLIETDRQEYELYQRFLNDRFDPYTDSSIEPTQRDEIVVAYRTYQCVVSGLSSKLSRQLASIYRQACEPIDRMFVPFVLDQAIKDFTREHPNFDPGVLRSGISRIDVLLRKLADSSITDNRYAQIRKQAFDEAKKLLAALPAAHAEVEYLVPMLCAKLGLKSFDIPAHLRFALPEQLPPPPPPWLNQQPQHQPLDKPVPADNDETRILSASDSQQPAPDLEALNNDEPTQQTGAESADAVLEKAATIAQPANEVVWGQTVIQGGMRATVVGQTEVGWLILRQPGRLEDPSITLCRDETADQVRNDPRYRQIRLYGHDGQPLGEYFVRVDHDNAAERDIFSNPGRDYIRIDEDGNVLDAPEILEVDPQEQMIEMPVVTSATEPRRTADVVFVKISSPGQQSIGEHVPVDVYLYPGRLSSGDYFEVAVPVAGRQVGPYGPDNIRIVRMPDGADVVLTGGGGVFSLPGSEGRGQLLNPRAEIVLNDRRDFALVISLLNDVANGVRSPEADALRSCMQTVSMRDPLAMEAPGASSGSLTFDFCLTAANYLALDSATGLIRDYLQRHNGGMRINLLRDTWPVTQAGNVNGALIHTDLGEVIHSRYAGTGLMEVGRLTSDGLAQLCIDAGIAPGQVMYDNQGRLMFNTEHGTAWALPGRPSFMQVHPAHQGAGGSAGSDSGPQGKVALLRGLAALDALYAHFHAGERTSPAFHTLEQERQVLRQRHERTDALLDEFNRVRLQPEHLRRYVEQHLESGALARAWKNGEIDGLALFSHIIRNTSAAMQIDLLRQTESMLRVFAGEHHGELLLELAINPGHNVAVGVESLRCMPVEPGKHRALLQELALNSPHEVIREQAQLRLVLPRILGPKDSLLPGSRFIDGQTGFTIVIGGDTAVPREMLESVLNAMDRLGFGISGMEITLVDMPSEGPRGSARGAYLGDYRIRLNYAAIGGRHLDLTYCHETGHLVDYDLVRRCGGFGEYSDILSQVLSMHRGKADRFPNIQPCGKHFVSVLSQVFGLRPKQAKILYETLLAENFNDEGQVRTLDAPGGLDLGDPAQAARYYLGRNEIFAEAFGLYQFRLRLISDGNQNPTYAELVADFCGARNPQRALFMQPLESVFNWLVENRFEPMRQRQEAARQQASRRDLRSRQGGGTLERLLDFVEWRNREVANPIEYKNLTQAWITQHQVYQDKREAFFDCLRTLPSQPDEASARIAILREAQAKSKELIEMLRGNAHDGVLPLTLAIESELRHHGEAVHSVIPARLREFALAGLSFEADAGGRRAVLVIERPSDNPQPLTGNARFHELLDDWVLVRRIALPNLIGYDGRSQNDALYLFERRNDSGTDDAVATDTVEGA